jgi:hypothetical protein
MGSATLTGILHKVEVAQVLTKERRIPWVAVSVAASAIVLCFLFGCWQRLEAMRTNYENQTWENTRRELTEQRSRLLLERSTKESAKQMLTQAERLGMVSRSSTLIPMPASQTAKPSAKPAGGDTPHD